MKKSFSGNPPGPSSSPESFDHNEIYCRRLGHFLAFSYCRKAGNSRLPCSGILSCWSHVPDILHWLRYRYSSVELNPPSVPKTVALLGLIRRAQKEKFKDSRPLRDQD